MKTFLLNFAIIFITIYFIFCIYIFFIQRKLIYFPTQKINNNHPDFILKNNNEEIRIIVANEGKENAILYFGGNGEIVDYNYTDFTKNLNNYTVYLMNYRGYGGSSGEPSEKGILSDSLTLYDTVSKNHKKISVIGRSLGSSVATYLASNRKIDKIVLITPFDSIENLAKEHYKFIPVSLLLKDKYNSYKYVKYLKNETHIIIAENDQIIPHKNTKRLIISFNKTKVHTKIIKNTDHNTISYSNDFQTYLNSIFTTKMEY